MKKLKNITLVPFTVKFISLVIIHADQTFLRINMNVKYETLYSQTQDYVINKLHH